MVLVTAIGTGTCHRLDARTPPLFHVLWGPHNEQQLIFEMSPDLRERLCSSERRIDPALMKNVHVAVSHVHEDHFGGVMSFRVGRHCARGAAGMTDSGSVKIYGPHQLATALEHLEGAHLPERDTQKLELAGFQMIHPEDGKGTWIGLGDACLLQHHLFHAGPEVEAVGFRLEIPPGKVVAYTGDAAWPHDPRSYSHNIAEGVRLVAQGATLLICDAGGRIGTKSKRHFNPLEAGALAHEAGVEWLALTHYTGLDSTADMEQEVRKGGFQGKLSILTDGQQLQL